MRPRLLRPSGGGARRWHATRRPGWPRAHRPVRPPGAATRGRRPAAQRSHRAAGQRELAPVALAALVAAAGHAARARAAKPPGSSQRTPWKAGPRGLDCSNGQRARLVPQRPRNRIHPGSSSAITTSRRPDHAAAPVGLVVGVGERAVAHAGPEVGGVRAVREVGDRRVAARRHRSTSCSARRRCAARRPPRPARAGASRPHLHELPVALVAAGVGAIPRSCGLFVCQRQYCSQRPPPAPARRARRRPAASPATPATGYALPRVVDVDRAVAVEQLAVVGGCAAAGAASASASASAARGARGRSRWSAPSRGTGCRR